MFSRITVCAVMCCLVLLMAKMALAGEQFGVTVYPNAQAEPGATKFLQEELGVNGVAFRTSDSVTDVVIFYQAREGMREVFASQDSAMFKKGDDVDVTIQSPWMDMQTGTVMQDCLISIVKRK